MKVTAEQLREKGFVEMPSGNWIKTTTGGNAELIEPNLVAKPEPPPKALKRIRQSSKPLMNALETRFYAYLCSYYPSCTFHAQSVRFKLGNGIWYKPDVVCFNWNFGDRGTIGCWEVKGPFAHRGGFENLKVAAHQYPEIRWTLIWEQDGRWQEQPILP